MSYQRKDMNFPYNNNNKINNINLISVEKSPNKKLNDINNQENNNPNDSNMPPFNDLIKTKNEDGSNFSNINIEKEQEYNQNADFLFGESDDEKENSKQNVYSNNLETSNNYTINEEKRIEAANNLFDRTMSMNSNINNDISISSYTMNTINYEKRKEAADILFQSQSDLSSKYDNEILNESIQTNKTNMTKIINNLTGSNMGLNINELANKCAERDKIIHESINSNDSDFIKHTQRENEDIEEEEDEGIEFNKNLIELKDKTNNGNLNDLNNLGNLQSRNKKPKISLKNALIKNSKKYTKSIINISDNNINNMDDNNEEKKEEEKKEVEKKIKNNIIDESIIRDSKESNKNEIIEMDKNEKQKSTKGVNLKELFSKNKKNNKKNEKVKLYLDENYSEEQRSNEILMKKKEKSKKENKIEKENNETISIKEEKDVTRKSELIKETEKFPSKEIKDTNNDSNHLITENNNLLKGRNIFSKESDENKFIQIQIKKKENKNIIEEENKINEIKDENNINNSISFNEELIAVNFSKKKFIKEKKFKDFLKEKKLYFNEKINNKKENENQMKEIKENTYYPNYIFNQETFFDEISKEQKGKNEKIIYYNIMKETYESNKNNFNLIFQAVSNEDKEKVFKLYKNFQDYNINNYISPCLNDVKNFENIFQLKLKKNVIKNIDFIRYSLDENHGDTFYRCFIFNLFEKKIINKDKEYIYMIIFDIFKIYDLAPDIFVNDGDINNNINNTLIFFDILRDFIELDSWDKVYDFFYNAFSQINQTLIKYIKYNLFLNLSKLYYSNEENNSYNNNIYLNQYKKILIDFNEPTKIIFQLISIIFGVNLEIIYLENKENNVIAEQVYKYEYSKLSKEDNNKIEKIIILNFNSCYHIAYKKKDFSGNSEFYNSIKENINGISLVQYSKKGKIKCDICKKNTDFIEIINENNNKGICTECLYNEIDQYLLKRIKFINEDYKNNYINYSYYLRPIELFLKEPLSVKNGIENNSIIIKNIDYYILYKNTFSQRIKELLNIPQKESSNIENIINTNSINNINNKNIFDGKESCILCSKNENVLISSCGCNICGDCIYVIISNITDNQIILNGYEKKQLYEQDINKCPICDQKINLDYLILLLQGQGRNFESESEEAMVRMGNYCNTICFNCLKKFENENVIEVEHNKKKKMIKLNVVINKHCISEAKKNKNNNKENEFEYGIDYNDTPHCLCLPCFKKIKIKREKKIDGESYKVVGCNICGINHLIKDKDWNKYIKSDVCCKCEIF